MFKAYKYGWQGLQAAWQHEAAFRTELIVSLLAVVAALLTPFTGGQRLLLLGCWVFVLIIELLNSAVEAVVDLASPNMHPLAGRAKDLASAAVLLAVLFTAVVWGLVAVPVWWAFLG
jgi:diacylglycerol kinase (ATP)